ncbi:unnamed protein product [Nezara viridula]|uniref:Uncharacterized protein n=1 Tax=Nezara viridula TaxID=85310 RepID=A0A9P0MP72_NEZVI|nr:unnamed protein product [Nezara viridula]
MSNNRTRVFLEQWVPTIYAGHKQGMKRQPNPGIVWLAPLSCKLPLVPMDLLGEDLQPLPPPPLPRPAEGCRQAGRVVGTGLIRAYREAPPLRKGSSDGLILFPSLSASSWSGEEWRMGGGQIDGNYLDCWRREDKGKVKKDGDTETENWPNKKKEEVQERWKREGKKQ